MTSKTDLNIDFKNDFFIRNALSSCKAIDSMKKQILDNMSKCTNKVQIKCQGKDSLIDSKTIHVNF